MMVATTCLILVYYVEIFGTYNVRRGVLWMPAIVYPEVPMACLYFFSFKSVKNEVFTLEWIFKGSMFHLVIAVVCQLIDASLYLFANGAFCKLQLEKQKSDCAARNEYFMT